MNPFHEMLSKISSSSHYDKMLRFADILNDHLGINHFWYYRINNEGDYCFLGTHTKWTEYCFDQLSTLQQFPCLRHPNTLQSGISLMKSYSDPGFKSTLEAAWDKFSINFSLNLLEKGPTGIEAFGFATRFNDPKADERLLNELPFLRQFAKVFRQKHHKLFDLLYDNQVNIANCFGSRFYERPKGLVLPQGREEMLRKMGYGCYFSLTSRERDVLKYIASGYPASYIAEQLHLRLRTIENYMATIKDKLSCTCKSELIQKANEFLSLDV